MTLTDTEKLIEEVRTINGEIEELQSRNNDIVRNPSFQTYVKPTGID